MLHNFNDMNVNLSLPLSLGGLQPMVQAPLDYDSTYNETTQSSKKLGLYTSIVTQGNTNQ